MSTALLLCGGGYSHPPDDSVPSLTDLFAGLGRSLEVHDDVDAGLAALSPDRHDLLVVNALRFTMSDERYADLRAEHAFHLDDTGRDAITSWHAAGRPILALHTGIISFDDWPAWSDLLGARWEWGVSHHPPIGPLSVCVGDERFEVVDECYQHLRHRPGNEVLATSADGHPLAWTRMSGSGLVAVDLLGHDARSLDHPGHRRLLTTLVQRLLEPTDR